MSRISRQPATTLTASVDSSLVAASVDSCDSRAGGGGGMLRSGGPCRSIIVCRCCSYRQVTIAAVAATAVMLTFGLALSLVHAPHSYAFGRRNPGYTIVRSGQRQRPIASTAGNLPSPADSVVSRSSESTTSRHLVSTTMSAPELHSPTGCTVGQSVPGRPECTSSAPSSSPAVVTAARTAAASTASPPVVYIRFFDALAGLGNKMFQYASSLGLALRHGCDARLVVDHPGVASVLASMKQAFTLSSLPEQTNTPSSVAELHESGWGRYDAKKFDDNKTFASSVTVLGYLQSWKYFQPVADRVRQEFALTPRMAATVDSLFRQMGVTSGELLIGVHVRRGDMVARPDLYTVAPAEFIQMAVDHYVAKYGASHRLSFLVATNDRPWVVNVVSTYLPKNLTVRHVSYAPEVDMALLSRCNHSIVTAGTFGWWSAWLAGGDVVYYKDFMRSSSHLYGGYDQADYYPPDWLGLA